MINRGSHSFSYTSLDTKRIYTRKAIKIDVVAYINSSKRDYTFYVLYRFIALSPILGPIIT